MKTILEELKDSWKQPWPRESLLLPELVETVQVPVPEPVGTNISTSGAKKAIEKTSVSRRGGKRGSHRVTGMNTIERRRAVLKIMKEHPEMNSQQIANQLGEPRGSIWHAILYIRSVMPELANWGIKAQGKWANQYKVGISPKPKSVD